ncbi:MAG: hypothetical protein KKH33_08060 [Alphaproteobacteria bacterium]|nr:hypothetical protein [Alphaproteobacteria bacterium]
MGERGWFFIFQAALTHVNDQIREMARRDAVAVDTQQSGRIQRDQIKALGEGFGSYVHEICVARVDVLNDQSRHSMLAHFDISVLSSTRQ